MLEKHQGQRRVLSPPLFLQKRVILLRFLQHGDSSINHSPPCKKTEECLTVTDSLCILLHFFFFFFFTGVRATNLLTGSCNSGMQNRQGTERNCRKIRRTRVEEPRGVTNWKHRCKLQSPDHSTKFAHNHKTCLEQKIIHRCLVWNV